MHEASARLLLNSESRASSPFPQVPCSALGWGWAGLSTRNVHVRWLKRQVKGVLPPVSRRDVLSSPEMTISMHSLNRIPNNMFQTNLVSLLPLGTHFKCWSFKNKPFSQASNYDTNNCGVLSLRVLMCKRQGVNYGAHFYVQGLLICELQGNYASPQSVAVQITFSSK